VQTYTEKLHGSIDEDLWTEVDSSLQRRKRAVQSRIRDLEQRQGGLQDPGPALELLDAAPEQYKRASNAQKAQLLKALVWNCEIDTENVYPNYKEPFGVVARCNEDADLSGGLNAERVRLLPSGDGRPASGDCDV